jgi:hypothetical protein
MTVIERNVLTLREAGRFDKFVAFSKKWDGMVAKHGFPPAERYMYHTGTQPWGTVVIDYRWENMEQREKVWDRFWNDPECDVLREEFFQVYERFHRELLHTFAALA